MFLDTGRPSQKNIGVRKMKAEYTRSTETVFFRRIGPYGNGNQQLMEQFKQWLDQKKLLENTTILGIAQDNSAIISPAQCRFDAFVVINLKNVTKPAYKTILTSGKYSIFEIDHTAVAINDFYQNISEVILKNNLNTKNQPTIERYQPQFLRKNLCEIMIPIQ